ncbi:TPA: hypothetical protein ACGOVU_002073 [Streptococcus suis]
MSHPIVPLDIPQSHCFGKRRRNDILMKNRLGKMEVTFFRSIKQEVLETILNNLLFYGHLSQ